MDRKYSDPNIWDNSIDWDDEADGSEGGYSKGGRYIIPPAMLELVQLRSTISRLREYADHKITCGTLSADYFIEKQGCDCGYDELMKELEETK